MLSAILYAVTSAGVRLDNALRKDDGGWWPTIIKLGTGLVPGAAVRNGSVVETPIAVDTSIIATKDYADSVGAGVEAHTVTATAPVRIDGGNSADLSADRTISITAASGAAAGSMSSTHFALVDGATNAPTVSTLIKRDADGRAQVVDPSASADISTKNYVDSTSAAAVSTLAVTTALAGADAIELANQAVLYNVSVTTTDATVTTALSFEFPDPSVTWIKLVTTAYIDSPTNFFKQSRENLLVNDGGLSMSDTATIGTDKDTGGIVSGGGGVDDNLAGTTYSVRVTGLASTTIKWRIFALVLPGKT